MELQSARQLAQRDNEEMTQACAEVMANHAQRFHPDPDPNDPFTECRPANIGLLSKSGFLGMRKYTAPPPLRVRLPPR